MKVLVVSDDAALREELRFGFPQEFEVELARDARDALQILQDGAYALVIADIQTGSSGGFALAKDMSQSPRLAEIPILMLLEREQDAWLAREAGARGHRTKPLEVDRLATEALALIS